MKTLIILLALTSVASAQTPESKAFWQSYNVVLEKQVRRLPKGLPVKVELRDRTIIYGRYEGYTPYDQTIWIDTGHWFATGFSIREVLNIEGFAKESL